MEEEPPSKKVKAAKPSEEKTLSVPEEDENEKNVEEEEQELEDKAEPCENVADVDQQTDEHNTDTTETPNVELKTPVSFQH